MWNVSETHCSSACYIVVVEGGNIGHCIFASVSNAYFWFVWESESGQRIRTFQLSSSFKKSNQRHSKYFIFLYPVTCKGFIFLHFLRFKPHWRHYCWNEQKLYERMSLSGYYVFLFISRILRISSNLFQQRNMLFGHRQNWSQHCIVYFHMNNLQLLQSQAASHQQTWMPYTFSQYFIIRKPTLLHCWLVICIIICVCQFSGINFEYDDDGENKLNWNIHFLESFVRLPVISCWESDSSSRERRLSLTFTQILASNQFIMLKFSEKHINVSACKMIIFCFYPHPVGKLALVNCSELGLPLLGMKYTCLLEILDTGPSMTVILISQSTMYLVNIQEFPFKKWMEEGEQRVAQILIHHISGQSKVNNFYIYSKGVVQIDRYKIIQIPLGGKSFAHGHCSYLEWLGLVRVEATNVLRLLSKAGTKIYLISNHE